MKSNRQQEIVTQMHDLRRNGTVVAKQLPSDIRRAKDWREYVRVMPIPSIVAAASLGFGVVFARGSQSKASSIKNSSDLAASGAGAPGVMSAVPARSRSGGILRGFLQTAGSWAAAYAVSQATQLAQQLAAQQLQVFKSGFAANVHHGKNQRANGRGESESVGHFASGSPRNGI